MGTRTADLLYLITIVTFIWALRDLSNPANARRGVWIGAAGMVIAIGVTFGAPAGEGTVSAIGVTFGLASVTDYWPIAVAMVIGGSFGAVAARRVKMIAMPQMV